MRSQRPSAVLFDVDGTLTDTNYLHVLAWWRAFCDAGEPVAAARIHRMIGAGSDVLLRELVGSSDRDDVKDGWRRHYDRLKPEVRAFPGATDLLQACASRGAAVVLATSSPSEDVDTLLDALDAARDAITATTSAGDVDQAKPEPDLFGVALSKVGVDPSAAVVVGDSVWDVEAARRAGLRCVGVLTGGVGRDELEAAGAAGLYDDVADLLRRLDDSPLRSVL